MTMNKIEGGVYFANTHTRRKFMFVPSISAIVSCIDHSPEGKKIIYPRGITKSTLRLTSKLLRKLQKQLKGARNNCSYGASEDDTGIPEFTSRRLRGHDARCCMKDSFI